MKVERRMRRGGAVGRMVYVCVSLFRINHRHTHKLILIGWGWGRGKEAGGGEGERGAELSTSKVTRAWRG